MLGWQYNWDVDIDGMQKMVGMKVYESDQAKIFNRSVKELILTRSKFQSANSVTHIHPYKGKMA